MQLLTTLLLRSVGALTMAAVTPLYGNMSRHSQPVLRQEMEDTQDLFLCSNPNFDDSCDICACERVANLTTSGGYSGPPCYSLPYDLRVGNPQGVSSVRSYSKWNCTLYANDMCEKLGPDSFLTVPPGPPGLRTLGDFDDRAVSYQCYTITS